MKPVRLGVDRQVRRLRQLGRLDLFVINGKARGAKVTDAARTPTSRSRSCATPSRRSRCQLRGDVSLYPPSTASPVGLRAELPLLEPRRPLLRRGARGRGINDLEEGQAAALIDFDNDGRIDIVVANMGGPLLFYRNVTPIAGPLGRRAAARRAWTGSTIAYGAKRAFSTATTGKTPLRELYPANGYRGQSDPRLHFGLGRRDARARPSRSRWPDGQRESFDGLAIDRYHADPLRPAGAHAMTALLERLRAIDARWFVLVNNALLLCRRAGSCFGLQRDAAPDRSCVRRRRRRRGRRCARLTQETRARRACATGCSRRASPAASTLVLLRSQYDLVLRARRRDRHPLEVRRHRRARPARLQPDELRDRLSRCRSSRSYIFVRPDQFPHVRAHPGADRRLRRPRHHAARAAGR